MIVRVADGTLHRLTDTDAARWVVDLLVFVGGEAGHGARHVRDGDFTDGRFTNAIQTYDTETGRGDAS